MDQIKKNASSYTLSLISPNSRYIQETWEVLFCTNTVLWSCISMSSTSSNSILGEILTTSALMGVFCWAWLEREAKAPTLLKTPKYKALSMLALWNFNINYPHRDMKLFFLPTVSAGFQAGELGEIHFRLGRTPVKWCENVGKMRNLT